MEENVALQLLSGCTRAFNTRMGLTCSYMLKGQTRMRESYSDQELSNEAEHAIDKLKAFF